MKAPAHPVLALPLSALPQWLKVLSHTFAPQDIALLGAGNGAGSLVQWLLGQSYPHVLLVEAHGPTFKQLARSIPAGKDWELRHELLLPHGHCKEATFHQFESASENGLLPLESLRPLWQGLRPSGQDNASGVTLTHLLGPRARSFNWLLLDCLPAATLLEGTDLSGFDVVLARAVQHPEVPATTGADLRGVTAHMERHGLRPVAYFEERNTALVKALYVREIQQLRQEKNELLHALHSEIEAQSQEVRVDEHTLSQVHALQLEKAELIHALDAQTHALNSEVQAHAIVLNQLKTLKGEHAELFELLDTEMRAKEQALHQRQALQRENAELRQALDHEIKLKATESQVKLELLSQIQVLQLEKEALAQALQAETLDKGTQAHANSELLAQLQALPQDQEKGHEVQTAAPPPEAPALAQAQVLTPAHAEPATENGAPAQLRQETPGLFECPFQLGSDHGVLQFNTHSDFVYKNNSGSLKVFLPSGAPGYLVSNETGDFEQAPHKPALRLEPGKAYELTGQVDFAGSSSPVVWLFEYDENDKKLSSQSFQTHKGALRVIFRTGDKARKFALAIRISGEGEFEPRNTWFKAEHSLAIDVAEKLKRDDILIDRRLEEIRAGLQKSQVIQGQQHIRQIESFLRLQHFMGERLVLPEMHGWPISPDLGVLLIRLLEAGNYDAVIEFGSGVSTLLLALGIQKNMQKHPEWPVSFVSFEHLAEYHQKTFELLQHAHLHEQVNLVLAPLVDMVGANDVSTKYYSCEEGLIHLRKSIAKPRPKILVFVDGPPAATGPSARFPALAAVDKAFAGKADLDILLDDYIRQDEREIVALWESKLGASGRRFLRQEFKELEKQACLLKVEGNQS